MNKLKQNIRNRSLSYQLTKVITACTVVVLMMSLHLPSFALNDVNVNSVDDIHDGTVPFVTKKLQNYDIDGLQELLVEEITNDKDGYINLSQPFKIFPDEAKINLTLDRIDIETVLRIIAKEGGKNMIVDESVQGFINADLKNVSLNEALKTILISEELEARVEGNTIFIASRPVMAKKGLNRKYIKTFKLNNANAVDVAKILEVSVFNKGYKVNEDASIANMAPIPTEGAKGAEAAAPVGTSTGQSTLNNKLVLKGKVEELESSSGFGNADLLASEIKIQYKKSTSKNIEISGNDGGTIVVPDTRTNSVLVSGLKEDIELAKNAISFLDKQLSQVEIKVSLIELSKTDSDDLGFSYERAGGRLGSGFNSVAQTVANGLDSAVGNQTVLGFSSRGNLTDATNLRINALIQNNKAKLLANPTIMALDGSESLIKITEQVVSKYDVTITQTAVTREVELADVGIVLNILPKIGSDGNVTMRVRPSITTPLPERIIDTVTGAFVTPISTREVIIEDLRVKSGETLAIAGLLKDKEVERVGKVPVLGSIPLFGKLFTSKEVDKTKTELMILITPRIIDKSVSI